MGKGSCVTAKLVKLATETRSFGRARKTHPSAYDPVGAWVWHARQRVGVAVQAVGVDEEAQAVLPEVVKVIPAGAGGERFVAQPAPQIMKEIAEHIVVMLLPPQVIEVAAGVVRVFDPEKVPRRFRR